MVGMARADRGGVVARAAIDDDMLISHPLPYAARDGTIEQARGVERGGNEGEHLSLRTIAGHGSACLVCGRFGDQILVIINRCRLVRFFSIAMAF